MANEIKLIISADAKGALSVIKEFGTTVEKSAGQASDATKELKSTTAGLDTSSSSILSSLKSNWVAASAATVGAIALINKAIQYMDEGAKAMQIESSFDIMAESAGVNSQKLIESLKAATKETIDDSDLMQKAVKLMTLGFDPAQIERFSSVVITASQIAGVTAVEAFDRLGDAIANKTPKALIQMGAVTKEQMAIVEEAINAGADSTVLFELAMVNLELKGKMLKGTQDEATISLQKFHAQAGETGETIGKGLIIVVQKLYGGFQWLASGALAAYGGLLKIGEGVSWLQSQLPGDIGERGRKQYEEYKAAATDAFGAAAELAGKAAENIMGTSEAVEKATKQEIAASKAVVDGKIKEISQIKLKADELKKTQAVAKNAVEEEKKEYEKFLYVIETEHKKALDSISDYEENQWKNMERLLKEREQEEKRLADERVRNEAASAKDIAESSRQLYEDIGRVTQESYEYKVGLLDKEYEKYAKLGIDKELIDRAYAERKKVLDQELVLSSDNFFGGVAVGYQRMLDNMDTWATDGLNIFNGFVSSAQSGFKKFFLDAMDGDLGNWKGAWNSFWGGMKETFATQLSNLAATYMTSAFAELLKPDSATSIIGTLTKALTGIVEVVSSFAGSAWDWASDLFGHEGGVAGVDFGQKINEDEVFAILQKGEVVLTLPQQIAIDTWMKNLMNRQAGPGGDQSGVTGPDVADFGSIAGILGAITTGLIGVMTTGHFGVTGMAKGIVDTARHSSITDPVHLGKISNMIGKAIFDLDINQAKDEFAMLAQQVADIAKVRPDLTLEEAINMLGGWDITGLSLSEAMDALGAGSYGGVGDAYGGDSVSEGAGLVGGSGLGTPGEFATGGIVPVTGLHLVHKGEGVFTPEQMKQLTPQGVIKQALIDEQKKIIKEINELQKAGMLAGRTGNMALLSDIQLEIGELSDASRTVEEKIRNLKSDILQPTFVKTVIGDAITHIIEDIPWYAEPNPPKDTKPSDIPDGTDYDKRQYEIIITVPVYIDGREVSSTVYDGMYDASVRGEIKLHPRAIVDYKPTVGLSPPTGTRII